MTREVFFFFQAEDGIRDIGVTGVQTCALPISVDHLLDGVGAPGAFDFLSLDIDRNTAHVWRALRRTARVACIEYNGCLPPSAALEVPYDPVAAWDGTSWFGAGLKTMERIGAAKGMSLVGCRSEERRV